MSDSVALLQHAYDYAIKHGQSVRLPHKVAAALLTRLKRPWCQICGTECIGEEFGRLSSIHHS